MTPYGYLGGPPKQTTAQKLRQALFGITPRWFWIPYCMWRQYCFPCSDGRCAICGRKVA